MVVITVAYDLETTGIDVLRDRIVQIAAVVIETTADEKGDIGISDSSDSSDSLDSPDSPGSSIPPPFVSLVNPGDRRMNPRAAAVTGISDRQLENAAAFPHVWRKLIAHILGPSPADGVALRLIGHNSRQFDDLMLCAELRRFERALSLGSSTTSTGSLVPGFGLASVECADTLCAAKVARKRPRVSARFPADNKLGSLYLAATGLALEGAHDALVDTSAVVALVRWEPVASTLDFEAWSVREAAFAARVEKRARGVSGQPPQKRRKSTPPPVEVEVDATESDRGNVVTGPGTRGESPTELLCASCGATCSRFFPDHACTQ